MLRIVIEWIDVIVYESKYRVIYVRSERSIDPTSTIDCRSNSCLTFVLLFIAERTLARWRGRGGVYGNRL